MVFSSHRGGVLPSLFRAKGKSILQKSVPPGKAVSYKRSPRSSSPTTVILARHGMTVSNRDGFVMGRTDSPLTREGIDKIGSMAGVLAQENLSAIYSSPLGRAAYTAAVYSCRLAVPLYFRQGMAELSCGLWERRSRADIKQTSTLLRKTWVEQPPEGECYRDAEIRVGAFIEEICALNQPRGILIVGHASVNRVFLKLWLGLDPEAAILIHSPHDAVYVLDARHPVRHKRSDGSEGEGLLWEPD
jgi:broad specificity phosphatase PhoE